METSFFGRERERAELAAADQPGAVVSLVGPGGAGKTRLATEHAGSASRPVWFCSLAAVKEPGALARVVAEEMGLEAGSDPVGAVGRALADRSDAPLLVLDNVEQVLAEAAARVATWHEAAPSARFLSTSRSRLDVPSERVIPLEGLPAEAAEALYAARALAARAGRPLPPREIAAIPALLARLDHLPLGIELAAARADRVGPTDVVTALSALRAPHRGERHGSLDGLVAWSWGHLGDVERVDLGALSVFEGPIPLGGAARVLDRDPGGALGVLEALAAASLVRPVADANGSPAWALYQVVRTFVRSQIAPAEARRRLTQWLTPDTPALQYGEARREACFEARRDRDDLVALASAAGEDPEVAARAALRVASFVPSSLDAAALEAALKGASTALPPDHPLQAPLDLLLARRAFAAGRMSEAEARWASAAEHSRDPRTAAAAAVDRACALADQGRGDEARALASQVVGSEDPLARAEGHVALGYVATVLDDTETALRQLPIGVALAEAEGAWQLGLRGRVMHVAALRSRSPDAAIAEGRAAVAIAERSGEVVLRSWTRAGLGGALLDVCRYAEATEVLTEACADARAVGNPTRAAYALRSLALVAQGEGRLEDALKECAAAEARCRHAGLRGNLASLRAEILCEQGRLEAAEEAAEEAIAAFGASSIKSASARLWRGIIRLRRGDRDRGEADFQTAAQDAADLLGPEIARLTAAMDLASGDLPAARLRAAAPVPDRHRDRIAARVVAAWVAAATPGLWATADGRRLDLPDGRRVNLSARPVLARIVAALVHRRIEAPGTPVSREDLIDAGWPGERIRPDAAANRLYVALSTLRELGPGALVLRVEGGWMLDPEVPAAHLTP